MAADKNLAADLGWNLFRISDPDPKKSVVVDDKKRKNPEAEFFDDDDAFESMMQDIDFDEDIGESSDIMPESLQPKRFFKNIFSTFSS